MPCAGYSEKKLSKAIYFERILNEIKKKKTSVNMDKGAFRETSEPKV